MNFVFLRNAIPSERQTLLIPVRFRHVPLSEALTNDNSDIPVFRENDDEFLSLVHVALKLRSDILSHPAFKGSDITEENESSSIPSSVNMFVSILLGGQSHVDQEFEKDEIHADDSESVKNKRVLSNWTRLSLWSLWEQESTTQACWPVHDIASSNTVKEAG